MRILFLDIDTLRADHLGCYGYHRNTSPNIDRIAAAGRRFEHCYVPDAPCLPSRAALHTGKFGIRNGVVNHGGLAADLRPVGADRGFRHWFDHTQWMECMNAAGIYPVSFSGFAYRHSAWWFQAGFRETYDLPGRGGDELAEQITPGVLDWLARNGQRDNWLLHVNYWDPHTPYRSPKAFGNPFADDPPPAWYTDEIRRRHCAGWGVHSAGEVVPPHARAWHEKHYPDTVYAIDSMDAWKRHIDGYDCGIRYADHHVGLILDALERQGLLDDTAIIVSSDHGENHGELNIYGDHMTADNITCRVPMIVKWPGMAGGVDRGLHYQFDIARTAVELAGGRTPDDWDAVSLADGWKAGRQPGRDHLVLSNQAWSCQRGVRWGDWLMLRTYHSGLKDLRARMLFNVADDPHLLRDLAEERPDVLNEGLARLEAWHAEQMRKNAGAPDPMQTVLAEGGPFHTREMLPGYYDHLRAIGRADVAEKLAQNPRWVK